MLFIPKEDGVAQKHYIQGRVIILLMAWVVKGRGQSEGAWISVVPEGICLSNI